MAHDVEQSLFFSPVEIFSLAPYALTHPGKLQLPWTAIPFGGTPCRRALCPRTHRCPAPPRPTLLHPQRPPSTPCTHTSRQLTPSSTTSCPGLSRRLRPQPRPRPRSSLCSRSKQPRPMSPILPALHRLTSSPLGRSSRSSRQTRL